MQNIFRKRKPGVGGGGGASWFFYLASL